MTRTALVSATLIALAATAFPQTAEACGGFFCNRDEPVDQSKERILFAIDKEAGTVEAHVQIFFQGEASEFAWVLPTPGVPELDVSTDLLFDTLGPPTQSQWWLNYTYSETCEAWATLDAAEDDADFDGTGSGKPQPPSAAEGDGVIVLSQGEVGPYEQVTLQAESADALTTWLTDNGFDLPKDYLKALSGYVVPGNSFVALRLAKDKEAGDIAPLKVTWPGDSASLPITLTSVAAVPDMRLEVYVLADARAVPDNYLHVQVNEAAIDWMSWGSNYDDTITLAANEAGGQAFATDYAGLHADIYSEWWLVTDKYDVDALRTLGTVDGFILEIMSQGFPGNAAMFDLFTEFFPVPDNAGVDPQDFYNCPDCYPQVASGMVFDPNEVADALDEKIVQPMANGRELLDKHPYLTRLTSSMSPEEMDRDPIFVLNDTLNDVSNQHWAELFHQCDETGDVMTAPRLLQLEDGREVYYPPMSEGVDATQYLFGLGLPAAGVIEDLNGNDDGEIVVDQRNDGLPAVPDGVGDGAVGDLISSPAKGCGCTSAPVSGGAWWLAGAMSLLAMGRRRRG